MFVWCAQSPMSTYIYTILFGQIETNQIAGSASSDHIEYMQSNPFVLIHTFGPRFMCLALCWPFVRVHIELFATQLNSHCIRSYYIIHIRAFVFNFLHRIASKSKICIYECAQRTTRTHITHTL